MQGLIDHAKELCFVLVLSSLGNHWMVLSKGHDDVHVKKKFTLAERWGWIGEESENEMVPVGMQIPGTLTSSSILH